MLFSYAMLRRLYNACIIGAVCALIAWSHGLTWFVGQIPGALQPLPDLNVDAAVVLTGGSKRIRNGLELLESNKVNLLFISGVNKNITVDELYALSQTTNKRQCCVELGHNALNTFDNKREVEDWLLTHHVQSFYLVTSNYHMPRSLYVFSDIQSRYTVIPYAVSPDNFELKRWWYWPHYALLVIQEYNKYLLIRLRDWLRSW